MTEPFIKRKAGDFITAQDWNEIQVKIRDMLNRHAHNGEAEQGVVLKEEAIQGWKQIQADIQKMLNQHSHTGAAGQGTKLKPEAIATDWANPIIDTLKTKAIPRIVPLYIRGSGLNHNGNRKLIIGSGKAYDGGGRGLTYTVIKKQDLSVVSTKNYDTYGAAAQATALATALNALKNGQLGVLTSYDAWEGQINQALRNAFQRLGLYKALETSGGSRRPYAALFEGASTAKIGTAKAVEVLYHPDKSAPFAEIRGWLIEGSFLATGTISNALTNSMGTKPAVLVDEAGNVDIPGAVTRRVAVATGLGPNDGRDTGQVTGRVLKFNKIHAGTAIRILYTDNFRVNGNNVAARWEVRIDNKAAPGGGIYQDKYGSSGNYHSPCSILGYATKVPAGAHTISIWINPAPGYGKADYYTGWNNSRWTIEAEEVWI